MSQVPNASATMTVTELEQLLHKETLQDLRDLMVKANGRERRRLAADLRRQEEWVPHWQVGRALDQKS
ncbi:MAG TPA: hypothetical protein VFD88_02140 [Clostridia bacterium]|nr:hypothetical protein [Clostridia bacterium]